MNIDYQRLTGMTQQQVIDYLKGIYGGTPLSYTVNQTENEAGQQIMGMPWASTDDGQSVRRIGNYLDDYNQQGWQTTGYERQLTNNFDPNYEGGVYGSYVGDYDAQGNLNDVRFVKGERDKGFIGENMDWLGPLMVLGPAAFMAAPEIAAGLGAAEGASTGLSAAQIADLGAISGATNAGAGAAFESALANSAFGAAGTGAALGEAAGSPNFWDAPYLDGAEFGAPVDAGAGIFGDAGGYLGSTPGGLVDSIASGAGSNAASSGLGGVASGVGGAASGLGGLVSGLGGSGVGAALGGIGGLISGVTAPDSQTSEVKKTMDPRFDALMFGDANNPGGLLGKWQAVLNRPQSDALKGVYGIANNFFAPR